MVFRRFIHIPGPNPVIVMGDKGAWDEYYIESCDVFKDYETYYWYYHGMGEDKNRWPEGYRIGVATASNPLRPWTKYDKNPILDHGPRGSWDDWSVDCAVILKEGPDKYYMFYSGESSEGGRSIGLATASNPLGPWKKYEKNPIVEDFDYTGGVVKVKGKYYMYNEYPRGSTGPDYGPISLATADSPEGPWTKYEGNPVLAPGDWGSWDDGGFSEAKVSYHDGVFHIFYGAAKLHPTRRLTRESIGYAYSFDGYNFTKYGGNPVALKDRNPNATSFSEVHHIIEPPFVYLFHTLRYITSPDPLRDEDLGVQVLVISTPFRLVMPVLNMNSLGAGATSPLEACPPISVDNASSLALTTECIHHADAKAGLRIHVRSSYDGIKYDTTDLYAFDNDFKAGQTSRKTIELSPKVRFIKVLAENLDKIKDVTSIKVTATLGSPE